MLSYLCADFQCCTRAPWHHCASTLCNAQALPPEEAVDSTMEASPQRSKSDLATVLQAGAVIGPLPPQSPQQQQRQQQQLQQHQQRRLRLLGGLADLPGAGHIQAAGHLPLQLMRCGNARDARVGSAVQRWVAGDAQIAHRGNSMQLYHLAPSHMRRVLAV